MLFKSITATVFTAAFLAACATTPAADGTTETPVASSSNDAEAIFGVTLADAQTAAKLAMAESGFTVKEETDTTIKGNRPRKIGALVGSGGEKITITLRQISDGSTGVTVKSRKTFVGIAGQKNWDEPVMASIQTALSE